MTLQIKVPYFSYADLSKISYQFLQKFNFATKIPVPIEEIIDLKLKINIFASPGLRDIHEIEGWTSGDLPTIFVDEFIFYHRETRFRFTLAHCFVSAKLGSCEELLDIFYSGNQSRGRTCRIR